MNTTKVSRHLVAAGIGLAALAAGTVLANDVQSFGRSSVYASARSTAAPKPFDGVTLAGNGRGSIYATGARVTPSKTKFAAPARTVPGNGRGSVYAWTNNEARS